VLHTFGLPEAEIDKELASVLPQTGLVRLGLLTSPLGVSIVLTAIGVDNSRKGKGAMATLARAEQAVRERLRRWIYAEGDQTMEQVVGQALRDRRLMLAVAESCTGGLICHRLTEVPGSSSYVDRSVVTYSNRAKVELLGVPEDVLQRHGAVSAEVAAAMAYAVRTRFRADIGLSVTGIAGPDGGSERKPVGLVYIGLDAAGHSNDAADGHRDVREFRFHGNRQIIKMRASQAALDLLRQWLQDTTAGSKRGST
jgi:nicotinamide-nucleotide amidase